MSSTAHIPALTSTIADVNGTTIAYDVYTVPGGRAPSLSIVLTPGGQAGRLVYAWLVYELFEALGPDIQCLLWDRRGSGASGLNFEQAPPATSCKFPPSAPTGGAATRCYRACCSLAVGEPELHADDLAALLEHLGWGPVVCIGESSGARLSLFLALRHPRCVLSIIALNITAGAIAAFVLSDTYYDQYAVAALEGGMEAVLRKPMYASATATSPERRSLFLSQDPLVFAAVMAKYRDFIARSAEYPVIGLTSPQLQAIQCSVLVLRTFENDDDGMHTLAASQALAGGLHACAGLIVEPEFASWFPRVLLRLRELASGSESKPTSKLKCSLCFCFFLFLVFLGL